MKNIWLWYVIIFCSMAIHAGIPEADAIEFATEADAIAAGWSGNHGGVLRVVEGSRPDSHALQVSDALEWGGLTWRPVQQDWANVSQLSLQIRQNVHPNYNFYLNIEVIPPIGAPRYISRALPPGAGWNGWESVTIDLSGEELGRIGTIGVYSDSFRDRTDAFLALDELSWKYSAPTTEAERPDAYTVPRLVAAPAIDGILTAGEWSEAGSMTGFALLSGVYAPRQTQVWYGHDGKFLYVAFSSVFESPGAPEIGNAGRLTESDLVALDLFELWLATPRIHWQYAVNMNQGIFQYDHGQRRALESNVQFRGSFQTNGYLTGGVWHGEFAIPLADIPGVSDGLQLLFARDFRNANGRSEADWTASRPMPGGFQRCELYPMALLADNPEFIRVTGFGDCSGGEAIVYGELGNPVEALQLQWDVHAENGNRLASRTAIVKDGKFAIGDRLKLDGKVNANGYFQVTQPSTGKLLHAQTIRFSCGSPLRFQCIPHPASGAVTVRFDTRGLKETPTGSTAEIRIFDGDTEVMRRSFPVEDTPRFHEYQWDASALPAQAYRMECTLLQSGVMRYQAVEPEVWLGIPAWCRAPAIPDEIPEPWIPLQANGKHVTLLGREYTLADNGFPAAIRALDKELLTSTTALTALVNGIPEAICFQTPQLTGDTPQQLRYALTGESEHLRLSGSVTIDYDGFARWQLQLTAKKAVMLDKLALEWTMPEERALYGRGNRIGGAVAGYSANLDGARQPETVELANTRHSYRGWVWPEPFFYQFMIGDDDSGISVMTESDRHHRGSSHIAVDDRGTSRAVTLTLTSKHPLAEKENISYDYAWTGLPLKPAPRDPARWRQGLGATFARDRSLLETEAEFFRRIPLLVGSRYMRYDSHWQLEETDPARRTPREPAMDASDFVAGLQRATEYGCQVVTDGIYFSAMDTSAPETGCYLEEWKILPGGYSWYNFQGALDLAACTNSSWRNFIATVCTKILDETPLSGVYLDVSTEIPCDNALHGCGYTDEAGQRHPTINLWSMRELHRQVYTYYHTGGRRGKMFHHYLNNAAWAGFCDAGFQGEDWAIYPDYRKMTPDFFRAMKMTQYGTPYTFFAIFSYWESVPLSEVMAICLPHHVLPAVWGYRKENYPAIQPYWDVLDAWWSDAVFAGYWQSDAPTDAKSDSGILISALIKPKQALLLAANWHENDETITVRLNPKRFAFLPRHARNVLTGAIVPVGDKGEITLSIPAREPLLIELGELP